jgi:hypothetical protein
LSFINLSLCGKQDFQKKENTLNRKLFEGLLASDGGYPLAYSIHEGNKYVRTYNVACCAEVLIIGDTAVCSLIFDL